MNGQYPLATRTMSHLQIHVIFPTPNSHPQKQTFILQAFEEAHLFKETDRKLLSAVTKAYFCVTLDSCLCVCKLTYILIISPSPVCATSEAALW